MGANYLILLEEKNYEIYFDGINLKEIVNLDYSARSVLFQLLHYKLISDVNDSCKIICENQYNGYIVNKVNKLYVKKEKYDETRREIYMFLKVACSYIGDFSKLQSINFQNAVQMLDYSKNLKDYSNEYHLLSLTRDDYKIYRTKNKFDEKELIEEYVQKVKRRS